MSALAPPKPFRSARWLGALVLVLVSAACSGKAKRPPPREPPKTCSFSLADASRETDAHPLRINEVMTGNDGAWVDEQGETDDFIELLNTGSKAIALGDYFI